MMIAADEAPPEIRARLAVALDLDDAVAALRLARELRPFVGVAKVGLELYSAAGPDVVGGLSELGYDVFCDLKFHDIPTTVGRAARVVGALGARYLNFHAQGGTAMLAAGVEGFLAGAASAGLPAPSPLAVTILTSEADAPVDVLRRRVAAAVEAGCAGVVCAATDLAEVRRLAPGLITVVPGIRPAGAALNDQARVASPAEAITMGADVLVIGRPITHAESPAAAAAAIAASIAR